MAFAATFIRLGNLCNSEIYGDVTNLPWGFIFERRGETEPKHPTQIYEALGLASRTKGKPTVIILNTVKGYGSPIMEGYRKKVEQDGFEGTIELRHTLAIIHIRIAHIERSVVGQKAMSVAQKRIF